MTRIGFDAAARDAKTPQQYIAAQMALCLEQIGELPTMDDLYDAYVLGMDEEFARKFVGPVREGKVGTVVTMAAIYEWLTDMLKEAMV